MKLGYACVSNGEQNLALQIDALKAAERIFEGQGLSGATVFKRAYTELADWLKAVELDRPFK